MEKHFVTFYSPGTFVAEESARPIASWDVGAAKAMAIEITERHSATPYGFQFSTRSRGPDDLDSKQTATSPMYYLGGRVETLEQIKGRNDPKDRILISNMECNKWPRVLVNDNSWRVTRPLSEADVILDFTPPSRKIA